MGFRLQHRSLHGSAFAAKPERMQGALCTARQHRKGIMDRPSCQTSRALHVLFLAGGNGRSAQLAGHWARALAGDCLQVEAADFDRMGSTLELNGAQASLVVVIHAAGDPEPLVAHNSGGRIDWYLDGNAITECQFELTAQLHRHVTRLLGDLGITQAISERSRALAA
jgi:hypothetical protein